MRQLNGNPSADACSTAGPARRRLSVPLACALAALLLAAPSSSAADPETVTITLADGSVLVGRIVSETETSLRLATEHLGEIDVAVEAIVERTAGLAPHEVAPGTVTPPSPTPQLTPSSQADVKWTRSVGFAGSFVSAPYEQGTLDESRPEYTGEALGLPGDQVNLQLTLALGRSTPSAHWALSGSGTFVDAAPRGRLTEAFKVDSNFTRRLGGRDFLYAITAFRKDAVRNVDNSTVQAFGLGRRLIDTPAMKLSVMPGLTAQREEKGTVYDDEVMFGYGFAQSFSFTTSKGVILEQRLFAKTLVKDAGLYWLESYAGVRTPLAKRVMLQVGAQYDHDELLGLQQTEIPGTGLSFFANRKSRLQITTGLQLSF